MGVPPFREIAILATGIQEPRWTMYHSTGLLLRNLN